MPERPPKVPAEHVVAPTQPSEVVGARLVVREPRRVIDSIGRLRPANPKDIPATVRGGTRRNRHSAVAKWRGHLPLRVHSYVRHGETFAGTFRESRRELSIEPVF